MSEIKKCKCCGEVKEEFQKWLSLCNNCFQQLYRERYMERYESQAALRNISDQKELDRILHENPGEIWRVIKGFEDRYMISSLGRILAKPRRTLRTMIMSQRVNRSGYYVINLSSITDDGKPQNKLFLVHYLVAIHFIPNQDNFEAVDHINMNLLDNRVENLRWTMPILNRRKIIRKAYKRVIYTKNKKFYYRVCCTVPVDYSTTIRKSKAFKDKNIAEIFKLKLQDILDKNYNNISLDRDCLLILKNKVDGLFEEFAKQKTG